MIHILTVRTFRVLKLNKLCSNSNIRDSVSIRNEVKSDDTTRTTQSSLRIYSYV